MWNVFAVPNDQNLRLNLRLRGHARYPVELIHNKNDYTLKSYTRCLTSWTMEVQMPTPYLPTVSIAHRVNSAIC